MTTISIKENEQSCGAFTLVELMFSVTILMIAMGSIFGTIMAFARSSVSVGEYVEMSYESRKALELFSRDVRAADGISVISARSSDGVVFSKRGVDLTYPDYYGDRSVSYRYNSSRGSLRRVETYDGTTTRSDILTGVTKLNIQFFQTPGDDFVSTSGPVASVNSWAKSLQLDAELSRTVVTLDNTDYIISARFMMRNMN